MAEMLGAWHSHKLQSSLSSLGADLALDPMAGWRDFRRVQHDGAHAHAHAHAHATGERHHHDHEDWSVVAEEVAGLEDGASTDRVQTVGAFVCLATDGTSPLPAPAAVFGTAWPALGRASVPSPCPWRIERPPTRA
ncbi:MAG: hypothetical protein EOP81_17265 [Variovorax sp.]|nr:MAG: hypothetical protein EOP81_17265 [Variovorax sp.]